VCNNIDVIHIYVISTDTDLKGEIHWELKL